MTKRKTDLALNVVRSWENISFRDMYTRRLRMLIPKRHLRLGRTILHSMSCDKMTVGTGSDDQTQTNELRTVPLPLAPCESGYREPARIPPIG